MSEQTGHVRCIVPGGEAVVCSQGQSWLVAQALPDEEIAFSPESKRRGAQRGLLQRVIRPSPLRIEPACKIAHLCGGCALQSLDFKHHASLKSDWVMDAFRHVYRDQTLWIPIDAAQPFTSDLARRRVRWHVATSPEITLGFHQRSSHQVQVQQHCMIVSPELDVLRNSLQAFWRASWRTQAADGLPESVYAVLCSHGIHVVMESDAVTMDQAASWMLPEEGSSLPGAPIQWWLRSQQITRPLNRPVHALYDLLPVKAGQCKVHIGPDDFVQGQMFGNRQMIEQIQAWSADARFVVDLFSGIGNLSLPLAVNGCRIRGAEVSEASVRAANANAKYLKVDASYLTADLFQARALQDHVGDWVGADVLIVDPPRKGAKQVCALMQRLLPRRVILVHCDSASAGRDAAVMQAQGYHLHALRALDLFAYSGHVESMSLWLPGAT